MNTDNPLLLFKSSHVYDGSLNGLDLLLSDKRPFLPSIYFVQQLLFILEAILILLTHVDVVVWCDTSLIVVVNLVFCCTVNRELGQLSIKLLYCLIFRSYCFFIISFFHHYSLSHYHQMLLLLRFSALFAIIVAVAIAFSYVNC